MSHPCIAGRPRYAVVAQALTEDILSGRYPVGGVMPTEHALCTQFNISRHTTREALRRVQALRITRRYLTDTSETYVVAVNLYPADRFTYSNTLRVEQPETTP